MYILSLLTILHLGTIIGQRIDSDKEPYENGVNEIDTTQDKLPESRSFFNNLDVFSPLTQQTSNQPNAGSTQSVSNTNNNQLINFFPNLGNTLSSLSGNPSLPTGNPSLPTVTQPSTSGTLPSSNGTLPSLFPTLPSLLPTLPSSLPTLPSLLPTLPSLIPTLNPLCPNPTQGLPSSNSQAEIFYIGSVGIIFPLSGLMIDFNNIALIFGFGGGSTVLPPLPYPNLG